MLAELDFEAMKETRIDELFAAWRELPEGQRNAMDAELREIHALRCEKGWCAIRDEAQWQLRETTEAYTELVEKLAALDGHFERAMVALLDYPQFCKGATLFCHADTSPYWRKRKGLSHQPASGHEGGRGATSNRTSWQRHLW